MIDINDTTGHQNVSQQDSQSETVGPEQIESTINGMIPGNPKNWQEGLKVAVATAVTLAGVAVFYHYTIKSAVKAALRDAGLAKR